MNSMKKTITVVTLIIVALLLAAFIKPSNQEYVEINMDALRTEIAQTVIAEVYGTIQAEVANQNISATATPSVSSSGTTGGGGGFVKPTEVIYAHMAKFISQDHNYMLLSPNEEFSVTYTFQNVGLVDWKGDFHLRNVKGMVPEDGSNVYIPEVARGDYVSVKLIYKAPSTPGIYNSYWELVDNDNQILLDGIWVGIQVE